MSESESHSSYVAMQQPGEKSEKVEAVEESSSSNDIPSPPSYATTAHVNVNVNDDGDVATLPGAVESTTQPSQPDESVAVAVGEPNDGAAPLMAAASNVDSSASSSSAPVDSESDADSTLRHRFGRLSSSGPAQTNILDIAEYARGHKSMSMIARDDVHNRWLVSFSFSIFFEFLLIHMLGPLAVPLIYLKYGRAAGTILIENLQLLHAFRASGMLGFWCWVACVFINVVYWPCSVGAFGGVMDVSRIHPIEVGMASAIFTARNIIIAMKYAYLSPGQLRDMLTRHLSHGELRQVLVNGGWSLPSHSTIVNELQWALKRTRVNLQQMSFEFAGEEEDRVAIAQRLHDALEECMQDAEKEAEEASRRDNATVPATPLSSQLTATHESWLKEADSKIAVPGLVLSMSLLRDCTKEHEGRWMTFIGVGLCIAIIHSLLPSAVRWGQGSFPFGENAAEVIIILCTIIISVPNVFFNLLFILIGVIDYDRHVYLMHQCSAMVTSQYKIFQSSSYQLMPLLDFEKSSNIAHWLDIRMVLKDWGRQYHYRIQLYTSCWVLFVLCMAVYLLIQLAIGDEMPVTAIVVIGLDVIVLLVLLLLLVNSARQLNNQREDHSRILLLQVSHLQRQLSKAIDTNAYGESLDLSDKKLRQLCECRDMLDVCIRVIEQEDAFSPVRILGFQANANFLRGMLATGGSAIVAAANLLMKYRE